MFNGRGTGPPEHMSIMTDEGGKLIKYMHMCVFDCAIDCIYQPCVCINVCHQSGLAYECKHTHTYPVSWMVKCLCTLNVELTVLPENLSKMIIN